MLSRNLEITINKSINLAKKHKHSEVTIEHLLLALIEDPDTKKALIACSANIELLTKQLSSYLTNMEIINSAPHTSNDTIPNSTFQKIIQRSAIQANLSGISKEISGVNVLAEILLETDSYAAKLLYEHNITRLDIINYIIHGENYTEFIFTQKSDEGNSIFFNTPQIPPEPKSFVKKLTDKKESKEDPETLRNYCANLNKLALEGKIDLLVGREDEINRTIEILCRRNKNNPLLVGEPGVGKTAIIEGLAHKIAHKQVPPILQNSTIYSLDLGSLLAGTRYRGDFEERIKEVIKELSSIPKSILFIDEMHSIIGAGATNGNALDASNLLKPSLARGKIRCVGSTTFSEFNKHFTKDRSLIRRFQQITVEEPSIEATIKILHGLREYYEKYHNVTYTPRAIEAAAELSSRYINDKQLPDKAIDVLDETGAHLAIVTPDQKSNKKIKVAPKDIENTVARISKIPVINITTNEKDRLKNMEKRLKTVIFGQDEAIEELCTAVKLSRAGLRNDNKPTGCYMFAGPTGVGKTELAIQLSKLLNMNFTRIDMSEYMEQHAISKLIGAPPGYVGHDTEGLLAEQIHRNPYSVVLLDEIEKAHKDIYNILLQVTDYGTLTDSQGKKISFRNCILIMTTNAGVRAFNQKNVGFNENSKTKSIHNKQEIERTFSPEFRNRLDAIIYFKQLSQKMVEKIADKFLNELRTKLKLKNTSICLTPAAQEYICKEGHDEANGARIMDRLINDKIKKVIANELLFGKLSKGGKIEIDSEANELKFSIQASTGISKKTRKTKSSSISKEEVSTFDV